MIPNHEFSVEVQELMHTPDVLFLDEPTNNLDPQTRLFLWERIQALHEQSR